MNNLYDTMRKLWGYIDSRYAEHENDEIDGDQLVTLTEGAMMKTLKDFADEAVKAEQERIEIYICNNHYHEDDLLDFIKCKSQK